MRSDTQIAKARIEIDDQPGGTQPAIRFESADSLIRLDECIAAGKYTLSIKFQSRIIEEPHGLFIQRYEDGTPASSNNFWRPNRRRPRQDGSFHVGMNQHFGPPSS